MVELVHLFWLVSLFFHAWSFVFKHLGEGVKICKTRCLVFICMINLCKLWKLWIMHGKLEFLEMKFVLELSNKLNLKKKIHLLQKAQAAQYRVVWLLRPMLPTDVTDGVCYWYCINRINISYFYHNSLESYICLIFCYIEWYYMYYHTLYPWQHVLLYIVSIATCKICLFVEWWFNSSSAI